jgi:ubiquinone/menaquinone biosynthesis C-methylase UbiE
MILDVGCGKNKRGTIGIDYSKDSDADVIADNHFLPFKDGIFNEVISYTVLEHSPNPLNFLKEQYRVLKKDGIITCVTDNAQFYRWSVMPGSRKHRHQFLHKDHYCVFYPENVERLLKMAGFSILHFKFLPRDYSKSIEMLVKVLIFLRLFRPEAWFSRFEFEGCK